MENDSASLHLLINHISKYFEFGSALIFISVKYPKIFNATAEFSRSMVNEKNISRSKRGMIGAILTMYYLLL